MTDVGGGTASGAQSEVLVPGLAWGMRNVASMITNRREVTVFSQPGEYQPESCPHQAPYCGLTGLDAAWKRTRGDASSQYASHCAS